MLSLKLVSFNTDKWFFLHLRFIRSASINFYKLRICGNFHRECIILRQSCFPQAPLNFNIMWRVKNTDCVVSKSPVGHENKSTLDDGHRGLNFAQISRNTFWITLIRRPCSCRISWLAVTDVNCHGKSSVEHLWMLSLKTEIDAKEKDYTLSNETQAKSKLLNCYVVPSLQVWYTIELNCANRF